MVQISLDTCRALHAGRDIGLASKPADQPFSKLIVAISQGPPVGAQNSREGRCGFADGRQLGFHQRLGALQQGFFVTGIDRPVGENILFQSKKPTVDHTAKCARVAIRCPQSLDQSTIDSLQSMQGRFGFVDLYFAGGKAFRTGTLLKPATKEGFAGAVFPPYRLEPAASARDRGQFFVQRGRKTVNAYRQRVQSATGNGPSTQGADDVITPCGTDHRSPPFAVIRNCWSSKVRFSSTVPATSSTNNTVA